MEHKKCPKYLTETQCWRCQLIVRASGECQAANRKKGRRLFMQMHSTIVDLQFHFVCYPVSTNITEGKAEEDNTSCGVHKREPILAQNLSRWLFFGQRLEKVTEKSTGETFSALVFVTSLHLLENGWYDGASTKFNYIQQSKDLHFVDEKEPKMMQTNLQFQIFLIVTKCMLIVGLLKHENFLLSESLQPTIIICMIIIILIMMTTSICMLIVWLANDENCGRGRQNLGRGTCWCCCNYNHHHHWSCDTYYWIVLNFIWSYA